MINKNTKNCNTLELTHAARVCRGVFRKLSIAFTEAPACTNSKAVR